LTIVDKLHRKWLEWTGDYDNDPPNAIVFPLDDFNEFERYLAELERNESLPLTWLRNIQVFASKGATEIKIGRLL
jgi:hypothetical protein